MADVDPFIRTRLEAAARDFVVPEGEGELVQPDPYGLRSTPPDGAQLPIPWALITKLMAMVVVMVVLLVGVIAIFT